MVFKRRCKKEKNKKNNQRLATSRLSTLNDPENTTAFQIWDDNRLPW
jgi:hypothetical protein